ncbi:MAG: ATP-binding cassette domain-containing protein [Chitinophagaceae bacterium]|nr:ATP-binding cassette domain-containing protein [Chitinophagaceae bacterium]
MNIELQNLMPRSLEERKNISDSEIWDRLIVFEQPAFIKITAPSGTGKTTFTHLLYNIRSEYRGTILIDKEPLKEIDVNRLAFMRQKQLSVVFQDLRLFPHLSARENIEIKRLLIPEFCSKEKVDEMFVNLGIAHIMDQKAHLCSYGEQQRIAIIRALVQPFNWLLMDEPFSHLDEQNTLYAAKLISRECQERNAGLIITGLNEDHYFEYNRVFVL